MLLEMIKFFSFTIPSAILCIFLFSKLISFSMNRIGSSPKLNNQLKALLENSKDE